MIEKVADEEKPIGSDILEFDVRKNSSTKPDDLEIDMISDDS